MDTNCDLIKEDIERYCRQIILPEIGVEGQKLLKNAKVLIVGAGGLGAPCLLYLAGAGVGTLGIVDGDSVDESNLHRQIIHNTSRKGINKAKSASEMLMLYNPLIKIITYEEHLSNKNSITICEKFDVLIDCSDNPATRYLVNDTAVALNKPLVSGAAVKWEGQLTVYNKKSIFPNKSVDDTPCYRCMYPIPTPASAICNCSDGGVFGPVPGIIGTLQASECIKLILGYEDKILAKKMLLFDGFDLGFKVVKLREKNKNCLGCGNESIFKTKKISEYDYLEFVNPIQNRGPVKVSLNQDNLINWEKFNDLKKKEGFFIENICIDVRPSEQFKIYSFNNFTNIPLMDLKRNINKLSEIFNDKNKAIYIMCRRGFASSDATNFLLQNGFINVYSIEGGLTEYKSKFDQNIPEF